MRDEHWQSHSMPRDSIAPEELAVVDQDDIKPHLFNLVKADDVEAVKSLTPQFKSLDTWGATELCNLAAYSGSALMVQLLLVIFDTQGIFSEKDADWHGIMCAFVQGDNTDGLRWILSSRSRIYLGRYPYIKHWIATTIRFGSTETWEICQGPMIRGIKHSIGHDGGTWYHPGAPINIPWTAAFARGAIHATERVRSREEFLVSLWECIKDYESDASFKADYKQLMLGDALGNLADTTQSIRLARQLLAYGAHVDARRGDSFKTPLHRAASKSSSEASDFMKFLLYQGADPEAAIYELMGKKYRARRTRTRGKILKQVCDEKGAIEIRKWLGVSWQELVERVREDRKNGISWTESD